MTHRAPLPPRPLMPLMALMPLLPLLLGALLPPPGALSATVCTSDCCKFVESFPARLRRLREDYSRIRDYYEENDDLNTALLDRTVRDSFKTQFACQTVDSVLGFYLRTVLPAALSGLPEDAAALRPHMESIQGIFDRLKLDVHRCRQYFSCQQHFDIRSLHAAYSTMESKGLYKAMAELDLLFNYMEGYLASKRQRAPRA